jgi:hypothetical protein
MIKQSNPDPRTLILLYYIYINIASSHFILLQGKGIMETFLLLRKDGFEGSLPCMPGCKVSTDIDIQPDELLYDYEH